MSNDRLRDALLRGGLTPEIAADSIGVDTKTVERWVTQDRTPYPKHRFALAALVKESESFLWPKAITPERAAEVATSEVLTVYPHRHKLPRDLWLKLFDSTTEQLDILVYAGLFLADDPELLNVLRHKVETGTRVRIMLGDPKSREVARRTAEERIGSGAIAAKIRNVIAFFQPVIDVQGVEFRLHKTTLYNSIYRFDDDMLVNTHIYGRMAAHSPVLHLRQLSGGTLFNMYVESFDSVWSESKPLTTADSATLG